MRIVGGFYRSRIIEWPEDAAHIRPTKDRVREAIFNALGDISNTSALDLYSGSGAMGLEAISRGSSHCVFVDISKVALKTTQNNIRNLKIPSSTYEVLDKPDFAALDGFIQEGRKFDLIFLDPPYKLGDYERLLSTIKSDDLLTNHGIIVMESDHHIEVDISLYNKYKEYRYGEIYVAILWR